MRREFLSGLTELASEDPRVVLLTADLGFGSIEVFADAHPDRFINVGVSEQAMIGYATGLADDGFIPYCYSIASFAVARTFEFLRNGPISHRLPVRLVGIGPGLDYGTDGHTHHALEDVALVLSQPNSKVIAPRDSSAAHDAGRRGVDLQGLVYYRIARQSPCVDTQTYEANEGAQVAVIAVGDSIVIARKLCESLGADARLVSLQEIDHGTIENVAGALSASRVKAVAVIENHFMTLGTGTLLGDALLRAGWNGRFVKWGFSDQVIWSFGDQEHLASTCAPSIEELSKVLRDGLS